MTTAPPFASVLVANRGEIAVRIIRTLHRMGIRAIAVYSDADALARHVRDADVAVRIGTEAAADSYLRIDRIVDAALTTGAQAIHPGYGFLSEHPGLAAACAAAGIVFVGPPVTAIEAMGDKIRAKDTVRSAGVRVVPGVGAAGMSDVELIAGAGEVGFPILIKPSAGGGGKGMRLVTDPGHLATEIAAARREASGAFGDDTLLLERFVERPRHIEVQVLADAHGNVVHLGERECSLQRRHQKIVEEAPSPYVDAVFRRRLGEQAVAAARSVGYVNAGTVELIVSGTDPDDAFFMEMNTRLQVEHPVTEAVTGLDLVEWQLRVAGGEPLGFDQAWIDQRMPVGHAIEARVYAEDPRAGFLPSTGSVLVLAEAEGAGVRVDSALLDGLVIGGAYDPMLAKVIAHGTDRDDALRRLDAALADTTVLGVSTNTGFLRDLLADDEVRSGRLDTGLAERTLGSTVDDHRLTWSATIVAAIADLAPRATVPHDAWTIRDGWRCGQHAPTTWRALHRGHAVEIRIRIAGDEAFVDGRALRWERSDDTTLVVDGTRWRVATDRSDRWVGTEGHSWLFTTPSPRRPSGIIRPHATEGRVVSPMPGVVVAIHADAGDVVAEDQPLVSVEAMKMEHAVTAPFAGVVEAVLVAVGQRVALHESLAVVIRTEDAAEAETAAAGGGS